MPSNQAREPWRSFLAEIDAAAPTPMEMHCIGGFAVTLHYGLERTTGDIDVWRVIPGDAAEWLAGFAGEGSELHEKHRVHLQIAAVATVPEQYADRLIEVFRDEYKKLKILILDPYDLALSKLERNSEIDIDDVKHLAQAANFDVDLLAKRYRHELRSLLAGPESRHDLTLQLWIDAIVEERAGRVTAPK